jgi:RHS repeat-associated protein
LLEVTHYYPFGLTMAGISSNALKGSNYPENRKKFQGQDFDTELSLDLYGFKYRNHDPQIGRFIQIDPLADKYVYNSTYAFSENRVTSHVELEGLESIPFQYSGGNTMAVSNLFRPESKQISKEVILNTQRVENAVNAKMAPALAATVMAPEFSIPYSLSLLTGAPVTPSPQAMSTAVVGEVAQGVNLEQRAKDIHGTLSPITQTKTTTAVASATTAEGTNVTLVGSSEKNLRPAQIAALQPGEIPVSGVGHAEVTILNHASNNNMTVTAVAASRPICPNCATAISNAGAVPASPLKMVAAPAATDATYNKLRNVPPLK